MIRDRNIANNAAIAPHKLLGAGMASLTGDTFYVAKSGISARTWLLDRVPSDHIFTTVNDAMDAAVADRGDRIIVAPNHTETISAAAGVLIDKAGVEVIGVGSGAYRPTFTLSGSTAATIKVTGANSTLQNVYVDATGINGIVSPFDVEAAGFSLLDTEVYFAKTSYVALKVLVVDSAAHANNLHIERCYFHGDAVANCTNAIQLVGGDSIVIKDNWIKGNFTTSLGAINNVTAAITNCLIDNNRLQNGTASSTKCIVLYTGSTGFITNNRMQILSGTAPITADACVFGGNYYAATIATLGTLL